MPIAIFNTAGYYDLLLQQLQHMIQEGFLKERNLTALHVESDATKLADWMMDYVPEKMEKKWIYRA